MSGIRTFDFTNRPKFFLNENMIPVVTVGNCSYIVQAEFSCGNGDGPNLLIGRFCSISTGIKFIAGMNHNYKFLSTYALDYPPFIKQLPNESPPPQILGS